MIQSSNTRLLSVVLLKISLQSMRRFNEDITLINIINISLKCHVYNLSLVPFAFDLRVSIISFRKTPEPDKTYSLLQSFVTGHYHRASEGSQGAHAPLWRCMHLGSTYYRYSMSYFLGTLTVQGFLSGYEHSDGMKNKVQEERKNTSRLKYSSLATKNIGDRPKVDASAAHCL